MFPARIYYCRISDDRQDFIRQVNGLKQMAERNGDRIDDAIWRLVLEKKPMPPDSPVLWDFGSRDMAEKRPNFQAVIAHVEEKRKAGRPTATGLKELCIYELDRFGVTDVDEWFHYRFIFNKAGCRIISALKGDLTAKKDLRTIIETLFEALNSTAEQKKIAGRVADQMAQLALGGAAYLGGVPRYGYDLGCFDGDKLLWRVHYRDIGDRVQIIATDDNPTADLVDGMQTVEFAGPNNHPKKGKAHRYELLPSVDKKRVEGVQFLFKTVAEQFPAISPSELARRMAINGFKSFRGRSFDADNLMLMLEDETYIGRRPYGKRSVARHKRYNKNIRDENGRNLEDVAEDQKGKVVWRTKPDQIIPDGQTHEPLVDAETFTEVQQLLAARPKGAPRPARTDHGWLKPVLYCGGCGRGMICRQFHGRQCYVCVTHANYRYRHPNDDRFVCPAGLNSVRHDAIESWLAAMLDEMEVELVQTIEQGVIRALEEEVARHREEAAQGAAAGFRSHMLTIRDALELDDRPGQLGPVVDRVLRIDVPHEQLAGLAEVEALLPTLVRQALDQAEADHRHFTKAIGRPGATARQVAVWDEECRALEARIDKLNRLLVPYEQQVELAAKEYQDALARLNAARLALGQSNNRAKGAVVARYFSRIVVRPPCTENGSNRDKGRFAFHLSYDEASLKIDVNTGTATIHALRNRCPSPLSSVAHGSPRMW